jgi:hypothetical protein
MSTFLATFLLFAFAVGALALGVICGREPLRGSCGGLRRFADGGLGCDCEQPCPRRRRALERARSQEAAR